MALYVHLAKMTQEGAAKIREISSEYAKWRGFAESIGAKEDLHHWRLPRALRAETEGEVQL